MSYAEFAGIMAGMIFFGFAGDLIGRNRAGRLTGLLMFTGVTVMAFYDNSQTEKIFQLFAIFFAVYGMGVGGEYPLTAAIAAAHHAEVLNEAAMEDEERRLARIQKDKERTARRGETIAMIFTMQGVGAISGSIILLILIYFSGQGHVNW